MPDPKITVQGEDLFSSVAASVNQAQQSIGEKSDEVSKKGVEANKAHAVSFKGLAEAIEDPVKGMKTFGESMLEGVVAGGVEAVATIATLTAGAALLGIGLVHLAAQAEESDARIFDLSRTAQMSVGAATNMKFAFESAGSSVGAASNLMFTMEQRMENSGKKVAEGLKMIGISFQDFQNMAPEERTYAISDAMRNAADGTNLAAVAMDILGRSGKEQLPTLLKPLRELAEASAELGTVTREQAEAASLDEIELKKMEAQTTRTWEAIGRATGIGLDFEEVMVRMKLAVANVAYDIGWLGDKMANLATGGLVDRLRDIRNEVDGIKNPPVAGSNFAKGFEDIKNAAAALKITVDPLAGSTLTLAQAERELDAEVKKSIKAHEDAAKAAAKIKAAYDEAASSADTLSGVQREGIKYYLETGKSVSDTAKLMGVYVQQVDQVKDAEKGLHDQKIAQGKALVSELERQSKSVIAYMKHIADESDKEEKRQNDATQSNHAVAQGLWAAHEKTIEHLVGSSFDKQRQDVLNWQDVQEGALDYSVDNWQGAYHLIAANAQDQMDAIAQNEAKALKEMHSQELSWANEFTLLSNSVAKNMERALVNGGGYEDALKGSLSAVGSDAGRKIMEAGADKIATGFGKLFGHQIGDAVFSMLPGIGGMLGSLAGPLINKLMGGPSKDEIDGRKVEKQFESQFKSFEDMVNSVGRAYVATGKTAQQAQEDVKALMDAEVKGGDAAKAAAAKIQEAFNNEKQDQADLNAALKEFNFTLEESGPILQKQALGKQAEDIENQFRLLVGAGVDVTLVEEKMSQKVSKFVQDSIKMGIEVPAAMRPMLEQFAKNGDLVDENGNKIDDLSKSGITFAETMSSAADRIVKGFNDILVRIGLIPEAASKAADAINRIPNPDRNFEDRGYNPNDGTPEPGAATGAMITRQGVQGFAWGGGNDGPDSIHAMVAPGELILNVNQQKAIAAVMTRGNASAKATQDHTPTLIAQMKGIRDDLQSLPMMLRHAMRGV
jgi:hypothetical protein